jgi:HEAT repeat protein
MDRRVRHVAAGGAQKLETGLALIHLIRQLNDDDRIVRLQAALTIAKFGVRASSYVHTLESSLDRETDPRVADALRKAIRAAGAPAQ